MTFECATRPRPPGRGAGLLTVLLLSGLAGCGSIEPEEPESTQRELQPERCEVLPPFTPGFQPTLAWEKKGGLDGSAFIHSQVRMTPVVVDVNQDTIPDVVFIASRGLVSRGDNSTFDDSFPFGTPTGMLRAYSGDDGRELWSVTDPQYRVRGTASLAAGDIDGDGLVELCTVPVNGLGVICFENTGAFKFRTEPTEGRPLPFNEYGGPSMADLDGDGTVELLDGPYVFGSTGKTKWVGGDGPGPQMGALSFAVDLDQDGQLELVNGRAVYRNDGTLKCANTTIGQGLAAVANFDEDARGELAVTWDGNLSLLDDDCSLKWTRSIPGGGGLPGSGVSRSGAPSIADFDNDGQPEIAVAGAYQLTVFEADGSIRWTSPLSDRIRMSSATAFDFEGDGKTELVFADGDMLRIFDGATGWVRFKTVHTSSRIYMTPYETGVPYETPVVTDVDADGHADLIMASSNFGQERGFPGIRVFHDQNEGWVRTRRIWNQQAYSITHVRDDGTVPSHPETHWLLPGLNTFRVSPRLPFEGIPAADLRVDSLTSSCTPDTGPIMLLAAPTPLDVQLVARVHNAGDAPAPVGVKVAFYQGAPTADGQRLGVAELTEPLPAGQDSDVTLALSPLPEGLTEVWAVVDDDAGGAGHVTECREGNNATSALLGDSCTAKPNEPPVAMCRDVTVPAGDSCQASASVDGGSSDPDGKPTPLSLSQSPTGPFGLGSRVVTLTATDGEASDTCTAIVTVVDTTPPTVSCPDSRELECQPGGMSLSYSVDASDACGPVSTTCTPPSGTLFSVGTTPVTCTTTDVVGNHASCGFSVTVKDTQAPTLGADKAPVLWPPNHQYVTVKLSDCAEAPFDACTGSLPLDTYGRIVRITSDEEEDANGNGDGRTCQDMVLDPGGTRARLRAERAGGSDGRVYTLHYVVTDPSGNSRPGQCSVRVPHDQSGTPAVDSGPAWCVGEGCPGEPTSSPRCME